MLRGLIAGIAVLLVAAPSASALDPVDTQALRAAVSVNRILRHERALQGIAFMNGGSRVAGSPGHAASVAYFRDVLATAGYRVREQEFAFPYFELRAAAVFARTAPDQKTYVAGSDVATLEFSGAAAVTGPLIPVDLTLPPGPTANTSTSGCEEADFAGFPAGAIALVQRGTCEIDVKAANAETAGAAGLVLFNEGTPGVPGRNGLPDVTLGRPFAIPAIAATFAVGSELAALAATGRVDVRLVTTTISETRTTTNLLADAPGGDASETVVVGAHLDSVPTGPGINDNGSGTATIVAIAQAMAKLQLEPRRRVRFALWSAEEQNLRGSRAYVRALAPGELADLYAYLNFDMLGSRNFVRFVFDGDGSALPPAGPPGSAEIEAMFNAYFDDHGMATAPKAFDGRSDYVPFIAAGIPAGGLFSGAEGIKTAEQVKAYGGTEGQPFDPCYHQACDVIDNLSPRALRELGDGAAHGVLTLADSASGLFGDEVAVVRRTAALSRFAARSG